jgi:O-acetylhomoserine/O-acetylserine sulfhydrylase-like pyridoxal-dependent enzyme
MGTCCRSAFRSCPVAHHSLGAIKGVQRGQFAPPGETPPHDYAALQKLVADARDGLQKKNPTTRTRASTYSFETAEAGEQIFRGERQGYVYGRTRNPTQALLEECRVASGMAAISSTLWTLLEAEDSAVIDHTLYGNNFALFGGG